MNSHPAGNTVGTVYNRGKFLRSFSSASTSASSSSLASPSSLAASASLAITLNVHINNE